MAGKDLTLKFKVTDEGTVVLDKISQKISGMDKSVKGVSSSLSLIKWDSIVNLGARAIHASEQVYDFVKSIASSANEIKRQAEIMGVSTDVYQKLSYAAKMADVDTEKFGMGMKFLARSIEEAKAGTGDAGQYFKALGIDVDALSDDELKLESMTYKLADAFKSVESGTGKTATAIGLLGRAGQELVPYFNLGSEAIKKFGDEAVKMGSVLGEVVIEKGSEAEKTFKELGVSVNTLKIQLAPATKEMADFGKEILIAAQNASIFSKKGDEMELKNLKAWRDYGKQVGSSAEFILDYERRIAEIEEKLTGPVIATKWVKEWVKEFGELKKIDPKQFADPEGIKRAQKLLHDFLEGYRLDITELNEAMSALGTKSTSSLLLGMKNAQDGLKTITGQFRAGKISVLDYANAIKSLTKMYQDFTGGDVTKDLVELEEKTSEAMRAIDKNQPDWQKQMSKITDDWIKERNRILESSPVYIKANLSKWEEDLREAKRKYDEFVSTIKPISIEATISITGEGSSKKPIMSKLEEVMAGFTNMADKISVMEAAIKFTELSAQLPALQSAYNLQFQLMEKRGGYAEAWWYVPEIGWDSPYMKNIRRKGEEMFNELKNLKLQMAETQYEMGISGAEKLFAQIASSQSPFFGSNISGIFQAGTPYVPRTGLAMVHEGEKIIPKNVRYGDYNAGGINITIHGNDPKKIADEVAKVLKYKRSIQLEKVVHG